MNVFAGFFDNPAFSIVLAITAVVQVLIIEFGSYAFFTVGISGALWGITFAVSAGGLLWGALLRLIPVPLEEWEKETPEVE